MEPRTWSKGRCFVHTGPGIGWTRPGLSPYTRTVMLNLARREWRREGSGRVQVSAEVGELVHPMSDHAPVTSEQDRLVRGLRTLPERQRSGSCSATTATSRSSSARTNWVFLPGL